MSRLNTYAIDGGSSSYVTGKLILSVLYYKTSFSATVFANHKQFNLVVVSNQLAGKYEEKLRAHRVCVSKRKQWHCPVSQDIYEPAPFVADRIS